MAEKKRSILASAAAWALILSGGATAAAVARDAFILVSLFSSPGFMLGLAGSTLPVEMPPLARFAAGHMWTVFGLYFIAGLNILIIGIGLRARKAWAFAAFRWMLYIVGGCSLIILLFPGLVVPGPYMYEGVALTPEFNSAMAAVRFQLRLISAVLGAAAVWFVRRFEKPDIKIEFYAELPEDRPDHEKI